MPRIVVTIDFDDEGDEEDIMDYAVGGLEDCVESQRPAGLTWAWERQGVVEADYNV